MLKQYRFRIIKQGLGMLCKWYIGGDYIPLNVGLVVGISSSVEFAVF